METKTKLLMVSCLVLLLIFVSLFLVKTNFLYTNFLKTNYSLSAPAALAWPYCKSDTDCPSFGGRTYYCENKSAAGLGKCTFESGCQNDSQCPPVTHGSVTQYFYCNIDSGKYFGSCVEGTRLVPPTPTTPPTQLSQKCSSYTDVAGIFHDYAITQDQNGQVVNSTDCAASGETCKCGITSGSTYSTSTSCQCFGKPAPQPTGGGTPPPVKGQSISHYITNCYNDSIYWYDSNYNLQDQFQSCTNNTCEKGTCSDDKCSSQLLCDGSTCAKNSPDYATYCVQPAPPSTGLPWYFWLLVVIIAIVVLLVAFIIIRRIASSE